MYKLICREAGWEISYGEGKFLPWRLSRDKGSGEYFKDLQEVADFIYGAGYRGK